ncbi:integrase core domain-containing protein [Chromobacterium alkanivorans]|uniref:integrase core domain-containing protein n=1 Tax=Chromobacterium alkanivorans TaxID=1071719 RepID=UPI003B84936F|nr:transposase [Chromobacterium sp. Beijing]
MEQCLSTGFTNPVLEGPDRVAFGNVDRLAQPAEARQIIAAWRDDYNQVRPHGSIGRIPPAVFAVRYRQQWTTELSSSTTTMQT